MTIATNTMPSIESSAATAHSAVIDLRDVTFGYKTDSPVLRDISASIAPGRVCALIGPNAAGKSTLLKLMLGQLSPSTGRVFVSGASVAAIPPHERAAMISYVPQRPAANLAFRVEQVIAMGRFALQVNADAIEQAIATFDLSTVRERTFGELSVGQQQRVALARAWAQAFDAEPSRHAMLLDEPVSAMDLKHAHLTMRRLVELAQRGFTVVTVLHDLNLTAMYADDVWLLHHGRLVQAGPWEDILQPDVLESVYEVKISQSFEGASDRPMFRVADPATMPRSTK